ncbi:MAG: hypothetical protein WAP23_03645 [Candidatus Spechtbacterales bacterium]
MRSIVICSSMRFRKDLEEFSGKLKDFKVGIVLGPDFRRLSDETVQKEEVERLKEDKYREGVPGFVLSHLWKKIAPTEVVYIYNKDGYIGHNTLGELFFAAGKEKFICAYDEKMMVDGKVREVCAEVLVNRVVKDPKELVELLK